MLEFSFGRLTNKLFLSNTLYYQYILYQYIVKQEDDEKIGNC